MLVISAGLLRCRCQAATPRALAAARSFLLTPRTFSSSVPANSSTQSEVKALPLRQWDLAVSPFTTVRAQLGCSISIRPLDPHAYPEADRAFIAVHGSDTEQDACLDHLHIHYDEQSKELLISAEKVNSDVSIEMETPIKSGECTEISHSTCRSCSASSSSGVLE